MKFYVPVKAVSLLILFNIVINISQAQNIKENWAPRTKIFVDNLIKENAGNKNSYTVFDWDNTSIYGDVQDNLLFYQLENLLFKMTPEQFKYAFLHYADIGIDGNREIPTDDFDKSFCNADGKQVNITSIAEDCFQDYKFFYENFGFINKNAKNKLSLEQIKRTDQYQDFRAKIWFTYSALYKTFNPNVAYTWVMYISATGFTAKQFEKVVENSLDWGIKRKIKKNYFDSPQTLTGKAGVISNIMIKNEVLNAIRPSEEIANLYKELQKNKIQVYICTASLQNIVEVFATNPKYGYCVPKDHVLGMRLKKDEFNKFLPQYDISGGYTINSMQGKAININNILAKKYNSNPIMIGGDSDGDYSMMTELSGLNNVRKVNNYSPVKLVLIINRLKSGNIGRLCKIAAEQINGKIIGSTSVLLQGRNENTGKWIPKEETIKFGKLNDQAVLLSN